MALTGLCPLPLPCGGTAQNGWTAAQVMRCANDVAALRRTAPFARLRGTTSTTPEIYDYRGWNGVGLDFAPTVTSVAVGKIKLTWPVTYEDDYGVTRRIHIIGARPTARHSTARMAYAHTFGLDGSSPPNEITVVTATSAGVASNSAFSMAVFCKPDEEYTHEDYGGDTEKHNSETEGNHPYGAVFYQDLRDNLRGSAYTKNETGLLFAKNFATARVCAALWRGADKLRNNAVPATSDEGLASWQNVYRLPVRPGAPQSEIRRLCAAQFKAIGGAMQENLEATFSELLGPLYIKTWYGADEGTLDNPPECTYWPGVNPGPPAYDLGNGTWLSERCHVCVEVQPHELVPLTEFYHRCDAQLFTIGRRLLPARATFTWAENVENGFDMALDEMDFGGMGFEE